MNCCHIISGYGVINPLGASYFIGAISFSSPMKIKETWANFKKFFCMFAWCCGNLDKRTRRQLMLYQNIWTTWCYDNTHFGFGFQRFTHTHNPQRFLVSKGSHINDPSFWFWVSLKASNNFDFTQATSIFGFPWFHMCFKEGVALVSTHTNDHGHPSVFGCKKALTHPLVIA
jgi:hypothetical protein